MSGRSCRVSPMPGSTSRGSTNTTRAPRSRIWRSAATGSATLRKDDLVTRGVGADPEQQLGALEVGDGSGGGRAVEQLRHRVLVRAVLGDRGELPIRAQPGAERHGAGAAQRVERGGIADVDADCVGAVVGDDRPGACGDLRDGVVPRDREEGVAVTPLRVQHPIGVVVDVGGADALAAGEPLGDRMVVIGPQAREAAVLDRRHETTPDLAEAAERSDHADDRSDISRVKVDWHENI